MDLSTHSKELEETLLYSKLKNSEFPCEKEGLNELLSEVLKEYFDEAVKYMSEVNSIFQEYTLHDKTHILNVIDVMEDIIPEETFTDLNCLEVFLLIMSAFFHDIGMYTDEEEIESIKQSRQYKKSLFEFSNIQTDLEKKKEELKKNNLDRESKEEIEKDVKVLKEIHLINFLRKNHGQRAEEFLANNYGNEENLRIDEISIVPILSKICSSHTKSIYDVDLDYNELISRFEINGIYLSIILRLADILDFDRTRTPPDMLKEIHSKRSLEEWKKHLAVLGSTITEDKLIFKCECERPRYQYQINKFLNQIEQEIAECKNICNNFPENKSRYKLNLPLKIDRSKIKPKDELYIYRELFIKLNKQQVIDLFMGVQIYNHPSLCIRELAQNSIDALSLRKALHIYQGSSEPQLKIFFRHTINDDGVEKLICKDTGIGMDLDDIKEFLLISGNSYYKSYDFKLLNTKFKEKNIECEIIAKFGIGFFSCFMIGDHIKVFTRKDLGPIKGFGNPFVIDINGTREIITISKGKETQEVGTKVEILKRKKEIYHHPNRDIIKLKRTLNEYFIKTEFPINIEVTVPNLETTQNLNPGFYFFDTLLEKEYQNVKTHTFDYSIINPNLEGEIKTSFLIDDNGDLTLDNKEAELRKKNDSYYAGQISERERDEGFRTCFNGIVVLGAFGRKRKRLNRGGSNLFSYPFSTATMNVLGGLQAPLNINRSGYIRSGLMGQRWRKLKELAFKAYYKMWDKIIIKEKFKSHEELLIFLIIYRVRVSKLSEEIIKDSFLFPFIKDNDVIYKGLGDIKEIKLINYNESWTYQLKNDYVLEIPESIRPYQRKNQEGNFLRNVLTRYIKIDISKTGNSPKIELNLDEIPEIEYTPELGYFLFVPISDPSILTLEWKKYDPNRFWGVFNSNHPISKIIAQTNFKEYEKLTDKEKLCQGIGHILDDKAFYAYYKDDLESTDFMRYISHLYVHLIKNQVDLEDIIPFNVFSIDEGIIEINDELLRSWL